MKFKHVKKQRTDWFWTIVAWIGGSLFLSVFLLGLGIMVAGADMSISQPSIIVADGLSLLFVGAILTINGGVHKDVVEHELED